MKKNRLFKDALAAVALVLAGILLGVMLLGIVYLIPQDRVYGNAKKSIDILFEEPSWKQLLSGVTASTLDNFTDALMLDIVYYKGDSFEEDMLSAVYVTADGMDPRECFHGYMNLQEANYELSSYARYWHGYQVILTPLLLLFDTADIRYLNMAAQLVLVFALMMLMYKRKRKDMMVPFATMWLCLVPVTLFFSMQLSTTFYVMMLLSLVLIWKYDQWEIEKVFFAFEIAGIAEAYFDFLTYPFVCLGVPAIMWFALDAKARKGILCRIKELAHMCVGWCIGYVGMWGGKWCVASLFTRENVVAQAIEKIKFRSSSSYGDAQYNLLSTILSAVRVYCAGIFFVLAFVVLALWLVLRIKAGRKLLDVNGYAFLAIGVCCLLPVVWYAGTMNHSNIHIWMTYRELVISIYGAVTLLYLTLLRKPHEIYDECKTALIN